MRSPRYSLCRHRLYDARSPLAIFRQNRHLLHDLPKLGAAVIQQWVKPTYGVRVLIMVIPHTFNGRLRFNSHLHILVSAGGLQESEGRWITPLAFNKEKLMHMWRLAVITFLREALRAKVLMSDLSADELRTVLTTQYERWWSIDVDRFESNSTSCSTQADTSGGRRSHRIVL